MRDSACAWQVWQDALGRAGLLRMHCQARGITLLAGVTVHTGLPFPSNRRCVSGGRSMLRTLSNLIVVNSPDLVLFVGEALVGNDAVDQLTKFNQRLADLAQDAATAHTIDGILLTKFDTIDDKVRGPHRRGGQHRPCWRWRGRLWTLPQQRPTSSKLTMRVLAELAHDDLSAHAVYSFLLIRLHLRQPGHCAVQASTSCIPSVAYGDGSSLTVAGWVTKSSIWDMLCRWEQLCPWCTPQGRQSCLWAAARPMSISSASTPSLLCARC